MTEDELWGHEKHAHAVDSRMSERVLELAAEVRRLCAALEKYGRHYAGCTEHRCYCGFSKALKGDASGLKTDAPAGTLTAG